MENREEKIRLLVEGLVKGVMDLVDPPKVEEKNELIKGKWYKVITGGEGALGADGLCGVITDDYDESCIRGAFKRSNINLPVLKTINGEYWRMAEGFELHLMTEQEILDMAKNYLEGVLGFKDGCRFKSAASGREYTYKTPLRVEDGMGHIFGILGCLFDSGNQKWAELVKEEEDIYIGEHKVEFDLNGVWINNLWFDKEHIELIFPINPDLFQKILDKLK